MLTSLINNHTADSYTSPMKAVNKGAVICSCSLGETNDVSLTLALLTKRSSYDTTAIVRSLTPRRSDLNT